MSEGSRIDNGPDLVVVEDGSGSKDKLLSREEVLGLSPYELVGHLSQMEKGGKLEEYFSYIVDDPELLAQFSIWEKWFTREQQALLDKTVILKKNMYPESGDSLPLKLEQRFTREQLDLVFSNLMAIQLTFGCSKGCSFCAIDAVPGVREHIPYAELANLFQRFGQVIGKSKPILYYASEPSDYLIKHGVEDKTYRDIHQLAVVYAGYKPHITTNEQSDLEWLQFVGSEEVDEGRLSVFGLNDIKINKFAGEKYGKLGMAGEGKTHASGQGISFDSGKGQAAEAVKFNCMEGVVLTPRGLYNIVRVPASSEYPQAQIIMPIEKVGNPKIEVGRLITDVLREGAIVGKTQGGLNRNPSRAFGLIIISAGTKYVIALDKMMRISKVVPYEHVWSNFDSINAGEEQANKEKRIRIVRELREAHSIVEGYFNSLNDLIFNEVNSHDVLIGIIKIPGTKVISIKIVYPQDPKKPENKDSKFLLLVPKGLRPLSQDIKIANFEALSSRLQLKPPDQALKQLSHLKISLRILPGLRGANFLEYE